ncbi:MAG TPA: hypothetical protein V6C85_37090 [Allocoleopsis sp.]
MRLTQLIGALVLTSASTILAWPAMAQTDSTSFEPIRLETIPEAFDRAFFRESNDYYYSRTIPSQIQYMFGPGVPGRATFPDLLIERDAERVNRLYKDVLEQQVSSDPVLRTPDLPNPFDTSIRLSPASNRLGGRLEGSEFYLDTP